jgi:hypothetical protein
MAASIAATDRTSTSRARVTAAITEADVRRYCEHEMPAPADVPGCLKLLSGSTSIPGTRSADSFPVASGPSPAPRQNIPASVFALNDFAHHGRADRTGPARNEDPRDPTSRRRIADS